MKKSWFQHTALTESQALELVERYRKSNYLVEKSLSRDLVSWEVSVYLPEAEKAPRIDKTYLQKMWRD
ncbi:hypothetical protein [Klebsiella pneumoniae]|uniref:hypothetical protein n=1 Tax=Klebsiella pneumoniae TaxID=573 RepID=UPI0027319C20|nr:hypothetical protein [Klebsiella pneumoniae]EJD6651192.1 hypothetical protein [Raoultella ornithinolytica]ELV3661864.1 hypothetical protein [Raoultella ornithinolytica]MDP0689803.1 hypothetical protein [Klebsiella pneumoniae]MDP0770310.1 hypothetical protein [Klebsiella pneumoniae]